MKKNRWNREALQNGIQPIMINVREKDQVKQQKAYLGAIVQWERKKKKYTFFQPGTGNGICIIHSD